MIRTLAMRLVLQLLIGAADFAVNHECKQGKRQGKASSGVPACAAIDRDGNMRCRGPLRITLPSIGCRLNTATPRPASHQWPARGDSVDGD